MGRPTRRRQKEKRQVDSSFPYVDIHIVAFFGTLLLPVIWPFLMLALHSSIFGTLFLPVLAVHIGVSLD